ncbi:fimbrial protein [Salmonella enterica]|nr:fimbrial protein [Salmonella enterica]
MKLNLVSSALVLTSTLFAANVMASDGTVHFRGEVIDSTCEVTPETKNQVVDLGKVNRTSFNAVNDTAAPTAFSIDLQKCPETFKSAAIRFDGVEDSHGDSNLAIGTPVDNSGDAAKGITPSDNNGDYTGTGAAMAAQGVAIRLYNRADNSQVKLYENSAPTAIANGNASLKFMARYIATEATVVAGTANADSQFTVEYIK